MSVRVYVAGQYSRNRNGEKAGVLDVLRNIQRGTKVSAKLLSLGYAVFCPWLDHQFAFFEPDMNVQRYKDNSMAWLEVSDCVLVISGKGMGGGVDAEIERANKLGIPVYEAAFDLYTAFPLGVSNKAPEVRLEDEPQAAYDVILSGKVK